MSDSYIAREPQWCWSMFRGAACLMAPGGSHAGSDLDGKWLRWTDEDVVADAMAEVEQDCG